MSKFADTLDSYKIANEDFIFNEAPIYLNLDKWVSGRNNILYITGFSGTGKGYTAKKVADKNPGSIIIELDKFENYMWFLDSDDSHKEHPAVAKGDKIIFDYLRKNYDLNTNIFDNNVEKYNCMMKEFYSYILKYIDNHKDTLFIIEGIQIFADSAFENISNKDSIIILTTATVKSMDKVMSRKHCTIRNHLHTFIDAQKKLGELVKRLNISKVLVGREIVGVTQD